MVDSQDIKEKVLEVLDAEGEIAAVNYLKEQHQLSTSEAVKLIENLPDHLRPVKHDDELLTPHRQERLSDSKMGKYIGMFFMICGIPMLAYVCYHIYEEVEFMKTAVTVQGEVIDIETSESYDSEDGYTTMYAPVFEYSFEGTTYTKTSSISSSGSDYDKGEQVEIMLNPEKPSQIIVNTFTDRWLFTVVFLVFGVAATGAGIMAYRMG